MLVSILLIAVKVAHNKYRGILLMAHSVTSHSLTPIGQWSSFPSGTKALQCQSVGDAVTHSSLKYKYGATYTWTAPSTDMGDIEFM